MAVNPKGYVPALRLDDGSILTEGPAIVQYVADQKPESGLAPKAGTIPRYHVQEWLNFITSELHKSFTPLFKPNTPEEYTKISKENLANRFSFLDKELGKRQYLMGDKFTVADGYAFYGLRSWQNRTQSDLAAFPFLSQYYDRLASRPAIQEAVRVEGIEMYPAGRKS